MFKTDDTLTQSRLTTLASRPASLTRLLSLAFPLTWETVLLGLAALTHKR